MMRALLWAAQSTRIYLTVGIILGVSSACGNDSSAPPANLTIDELDCEPGQPSEGTALLPEGLLARAQYYACPWPRAVGGAQFREVELDEAILTGIPTPVRALADASESLLGRTVLVSAGSSGFYALQVEEDTSELAGELFWSETLRSGDQTLRFGILADGSTLARPEIGQTLAQPFYVIKVGSGDIQINLRWSKKVDMDLHVEEPSGVELFYGNKESASGGTLDLDSYAGCLIMGDRGRGNENVFWPDGHAPRGMYTVRVNLFDSCDLTGPFTYRVTVVQDRTQVQTFEGSIPIDSFGGGPQVVATFMR